MHRNIQCIVGTGWAAVALLPTASTDWPLLWLTAHRSIMPQDDNAILSAHMAADRCTQQACTPPTYRLLSQLPPLFQTNEWSRKAPSAVWRGWVLSRREMQNKQTRGKRTIRQFSPQVVRGGKQKAARTFLWLLNAFSRRDLLYLRLFARSCISFPPFFFQGNLVLFLSLRHGATHRATKLESPRKVRSVSEPDRAALQTTPKRFLGRTLSRYNHFVTLSFLLRKPGDEKFEWCTRDPNKVVLMAGYN